MDRLLAADILSPRQDAELLAYCEGLNPAAIGRQITDIQSVLPKLAKYKTNSAPPPASRHPVRGPHGRLDQGQLTPSFVGIPGWHGAKVLRAA